MAITVYGRGYPAVLNVISDAVITITLNGGTPVAITSAGVISGTTFSGTTIGGTTLTATTVSAANVYATTVTGTALSGATLSSTTLCGMNVYAGTAAYIGSMSGTVATSAGGSDWAFTASGAGKTYSGDNSFTQKMSADKLLRVYSQGSAYFIPCMSGWAYGA